MNGAALSHLNPKNNLRGRFKENINYPLLFNQHHLVNHLLKPLMYLMRLGDTDKSSMDQVIYCEYKSDEHVDEHAPKVNNSDIFPPEGHQVPNLTKDDEVGHDSLALGGEDYY